MDIQWGQMFGDNIVLDTPLPLIHDRILIFWIFGFRGRKHFKKWRLNRNVVSATERTYFDKKRNP